MLGRNYTNYVFKEEVTNYRLPNYSSVLFINLKQLSEQSESVLVKDMAAYLLGKIIESRDKSIQSVIENFNQSFQSFKNVTVISLKEVWTEEVIAEALEEGREEGMRTALKVLTLLNKKYTVQQIAEELNVSTKFVISVIGELN